MAGILNFLGLDSAPQGGILGSVQSQPPAWADKLGIFGAGLADVGASLAGKPGAATNLDAFSKEMRARQLLGAVNSSDPAVRQQGYQAAIALGIDPAPFQKAQASQALPQLMANSQPMAVAVTPEVGSTNPAAPAQRAAAQAINASSGLQTTPTFQQSLALTGSPELTAEMAPQLIRSQIEQQQRQVLPATVAQKAAVGLSPDTPAQFEVATGRVMPVADPNAITPYQQANLDRLDSTAAEGARHDRAMEANAAKTAGKQSIPTGYRLAADGLSLEYIPGGPADPAKGAGKKAPTEDQAKNNQLYTRAIQQLPIALNNFDALGGLGNQVGRTAAGVLSLGHADPNVLTGNQGQQASNAIKDISASYLYSVSGATANPGEVANLAETVMPKLYDSKEVVAQKKDRLRQMVDSIKLRAQPGIGSKAASAVTPSPQDLPRKNAPKTIRFEDLP